MAKSDVTSEQLPIKRKGGFQKGKSGNPGGRPKVVAEVRDLARTYTQAAIKTIASIMEDQDAPHHSRVAAAMALLERGWGKAEQRIEHGGSIDLVGIRERLESRVARIALRVAEDDVSSVTH